MISFDDFKKLDIRIAKILKVTAHPDADKLYILTIDIGEEQKQIVAGIKKYYSADELINKLIVIVNNLEPVTVRGVESKAMLLAAEDKGKVFLIIPDSPVSPGSKIK